MRKLLYIPHPHATEEKESFYHSFQKKYECTFYKHNSENSINDETDVVYVHAGAMNETLAESIKRNIPNVKIIQWGGDCREGIMPDFVRLKSFVDITFLACGMGEQKAMYEKELGRVEWLPHGVADWQFKPINTEAKGIVFIGNHYGEFSGDKARYEICKQLKETYGSLFKVYGNGFGELSEGTVPFESTPDVYNDAYISIDGSIFYDKDGYFSNRPLCAMAAGSVCAVRRFPQIEKCFPNEWIWDTFDELKQKIDWLLDRPEARLVLARQQQRFVEKHYHYDGLVDKIDKVLWSNE